jgi:hypothetical protein
LFKTPIDPFVSNCLFHHSSKTTMTAMTTHQFLLIISVAFTMIPFIYALYKKLIIHSLFGAFMSMLTMNHHYINDCSNEFDSIFTTPIWSVYGCYLIYNIFLTWDMLFYMYIASYMILVYKIAAIQFEYSKLHKEEKWISFYIYYLSVVSTSQILCVWNVLPENNH